MSEGESVWESKGVYLIEARDAVIRGLIGDDDWADHMVNEVSFYHPPDLDFEYYDYEASRIVYQLAKRGMLSQSFTEAELAELAEEVLSGV